MSDRSPQRMPLLGLGILSVVLHQAIALWLLLYAISQPENGPLDVFGYMLYVLCWPFALVAHKLYHYGSLLLIASWFFGSLFWATVICLLYGLYRSKRFPCVRA